MKPFVLLLLIVLFLSPAFSQQSINPIDVKHYAFQLQLNDSIDVIKGKADITVQFTALANRLQLDLMNKNSQGKGMQIMEITAKSNPLTYKHDQDQVTITF